MPDSASSNARDTATFRYNDRVIGRLGETGTVLGYYNDGSVLVALDREPQNRVRYMPADLRPANEAGDA